MRSPVATWHRSSRTGGGGPKLAQDADLGQKCEPVWDAPVLDYSPVDYPGYVDDVDRDGLMGRSRAHHRAFVGAARGSPDPCGPVDTGVLLEQWISLLSGMLEAKGVVKVRGAVPVPKIITFQRSWGEPSNGDPRITRCENSQARSSPEPAKARSRRPRHPCSE